MSTSSNRHLRWPEYVPARSSTRSTISARRRPSSRTTRPYSRAVAGVGDDSRRQVVAGGTDDGEGRAQVVRNAGHELDLPVGQAARALGGDDDQDGAGEEQGENASAHREIALAHRGDHRVDGAGAVPGEEAPVAGVATPAEGRHPPSAERRRPLAAARAVGPRPRQGGQVGLGRVLEPDAEQPDRRVGRAIGGDGRVGGVDHVRRAPLPVHADAVVPLTVGGEMARRERREQPLAETGPIELDEREPGEAKRKARPATARSPAPELRRRRDESRQVGVDRVEEATATRIRSRGTARRAEALPRRPQLDRPFGRDERPGPRVEPAQPVAVDDVHRAHDPGLSGPLRPEREARRVGRRVPASNRRRVCLQPEEGQRDLAVEVPAQLRRAGARPGPQPRRVRLADLPEPAVLQRREDREEHRRARSPPAGETDGAARQPSRASRAL